MTIKVSACARGLLGRVVRAVQLARIAHFLKRKRKSCRNGVWVVNRKSTAPLQKVGLARLEEMQVVSQTALRFINKGSCLVERKGQANHCQYNLSGCLAIGRGCSI